MYHELSFNSLERLKPNEIKYFSDFLTFTRPKILREFYLDCSSLNFLMLTSENEKERDELPHNSITALPTKIIYLLYIWIIYFISSMSYRKTLHDEVCNIIISTKNYSWGRTQAKRDWFNQVWNWYQWWVYSRLIYRFSH